MDNKIKLPTYAFLMLTSLTNWLVTAFNTLPVNLNLKMFVRLVPRRFLERFTVDKTSNGRRTVIDYCVLSPVTRQYRMVSMS